MLVILFLVWDKAKLKWNNTIKWFLIGGGVFIGISFISTLLSKYSSVAWWGMPDRSEGFVMTACYIIMMGYTMYSLMNYKNYTYIIVALGFLVMISTIIGVFQYFGYDLFSNVDFFKNLVLDEASKELGANLESVFESGKVYGTMFHYNYMGSFGAMMVPFFVTLTLFMRNKWVKLFSGFMSLCSMFLLFGSTSRAGIIGLMVAVVIGMIIFGKKIIKSWKITVPVVIGLVAILFGFNAVTGGTIFSRIPTLINDTIGIFTKSDEDFDYRDHIPVREVVHEEDGRMKIVFQTETLYISNVDNNPVFIDGEGNEIEYTLNLSGELSDLQTVYITQDERFSKVSFAYAKVTGLEEGQESPVVLRMIYDGKDTLLFLLNEKGVVLADACPIQEIEMAYPESVGFKGKEKIGSARGYIWSRSIPLMKDTMLIGNGPDTFAIVFPQHDFLGKWWAYDTPNMIVDKVHNLYLALFINNGGLALLGFLIMMGAYIIQSLKLYAFRAHYEQKHILGIATVLAILGYLGAGIFNDSVVSVAPIFWILLGAGIGVNYLIKEEKQVEERLNQMNA